MKTVDRIFDVYFSSNEVLVSYRTPFPTLVCFHGNWNEECESLIDHCTEEWLVLPAKPILYGYFQFFYFTNRSINEFKENIASHFVYFQAKNCPCLLSTFKQVKIIDGLTCTYISNQTSCKNSSYFYCNISRKCISYNRIINGIDELNYPNTNCSFNEFLCKNKNLHSTSCLPFSNMFHKQLNNCTDDEFITEIYCDENENHTNEIYRRLNTTKCLSRDKICSDILESDNLQADKCLRMSQYFVSINSSSYVLTTDINNTFLCTIDSQSTQMQNCPVNYLITRRHGYSLAIPSNAPFIEDVILTNPNKILQPKQYSHYGVLVLSGINQAKRCLRPPNHFDFHIRMRRVK
ncbi:hypothetical protein I4U23_011958 [Adineta vaga]|nr:hypothetical protein I4U23_011958 [Adineta vaga]